MSSDLGPTARAADRHLQRIGIDTTRLAMLDTLSRPAVTDARAALGDDATPAAQADTAPVGDTVGAGNGNVGNSAESARLTEREWHVTRLLGTDAGISNKQLAGQLYINVRTVEAHMNHIMRKLGVSSRAQIAVWATTHRPQAR